MAITVEPTRTCLKQDQIIKTGSSRAMEIERCKTIRARDIGLRSGLFCVPEVVDFRPESGELTLKRIDGLNPLNRALSEQKIGPENLHGVGAALAVIHRELYLPPEMQIEIADQLDHVDGPKVFLHGDFNMENVCLYRSSGNLVILDWHMMRFYGDTATYGTAYFDVAWFLSSLYWKTILDTNLFLRLAGLARSFLHGYFGSDWINHKERFGEYLTRLTHQWMVKRRTYYDWRRNLADAPADFLFVQFARRLARDGALT